MLDIGAEGDAAHRGQQLASTALSAAMTPSAQHTIGEYVRRGATCRSVGVGDDFLYFATIRRKFCLLQRCICRCLMRRFA